jgi:hypothetical protein
VSTAVYTGERVIGEDSAPTRKRTGTAAKGDDEDNGPKPKKASLAAKATVIVPLKAEKQNSKAIAAKFAGYGVAAAAVSRDEPGGRFKFSAAEGASAAEKALAASFRPNRSPEEVLRSGAFGGTYFRTIHSAVAKATLSDAWKELPASWTEGLSPTMYLSRPWNKYDETVNKYGVKSGQTLEEWESSGWISADDPFGWFQWYCRFFQGRRCADDERQIGRWLKCCGPTGRWLGNLCGKIFIARAEFDDNEVSPVVRQTLFHWYVLLRGAHYVSFFVGFTLSSSRTKQGF